MALPVADPTALDWPDWAHYWTRDKYGLQMLHAVEPSLTAGDTWCSAERTDWICVHNRAYGFKGISGERLIE